MSAERVQRLVLSAPIAKTFGSRLEASKAIGQIAFPGYGSGGFVEQSQADGSVLMGFSVEIPRAGEERYFVFQGNDGLSWNLGDGRYTEQFTWRVNPQSITAK